MKWSDVRYHYPDRIVLVEALKTTSENSVRTVEEMSILSDFHDNKAAWQTYKKHRKEQPQKELYIFHTSKEKPEVIEQFFVGIRGH